MSKKKAAAPRKVGVIIANTGTPEAPTRKAVKKYLSQFLMDPRICPMPRPVWWTLLHTHILGKRSRASAEKYEKIWTEEGSPLIAITTSLERGLNEYYADRGLPVMVRAGMSYGKPQIKRVVKELKEAGCTELVVLFLYGVSLVGSVRGSLLGVAEPAGAMIIAAMWLHTPFSAADWAGLVLMAAMIVLVSLSGRSVDRRTDTP